MNSLASCKVFFFPQTSGGEAYRGVGGMYRRVGGWACRRMGVSASDVRSSGLSTGFDYPAVGLIDHSYDLGQNLIASVVKLGEDLLRNIAMPKSDLCMHLGFRGFSLRVIQLRHKGSLVSPLSPRLRHIRAYRTRGSSDLIRKRVLLLGGKLLGQFEDAHYQCHSSSIKRPIRENA
jgi:hypothetical protein